MEEVKAIVYIGIFQGWAKDNIIGQIMFEIGTEEEVELLGLWNDIPELEARAEKLYNKYREEYYKEIA